MRPENPHRRVLGNTVRWNGDRVTLRERCSQASCSACAHDFPLLCHRWGNRFREAKRCTQCHIASSGQAGRDSCVTLGLGSSPQGWLEDGEGVSQAVEGMQVQEAQSKPPKWTDLQVSGERFISQPSFEALNLGLVALPPPVHL